MDIGQIILDELNDWVFNVEDQAGNKMNVVEDCDFKQIIPNIVKKLTIPVVVKSLPSIVEINFDGHLKCQIETTDKSLTVLKAVNGYGNPIDCNKDKTIITEI